MGSRSVGRWPGDGWRSREPPEAARPPGPVRCSADTAQRRANSAVTKPAPSFSQNARKRSSADPTSLELESQGPPQAQILLGRLSQGRHDTSSGHGWARVCKATTSTLA